VSFILDALRKSEHERQQSALPSLAQVPVAAPSAQLPRWVVIVIAALATAVVAFAFAWFKGLQRPVTAGAAFPATVERRIELPPAPPPVTTALTPSAAATDAGAARAPAARGRETLAALAAQTPPETPASQDAPATPPEPVDDGGPALPSAAALAAQGVILPPLRLELHGFSASPADRFVFINGRRYAEGARLPEGPELVSIEPRGAVLRHSGQRFLLVPE
jgi:general secretion pathway protein B